MTMNYASWFNDDDSVPAMIPDITILQNPLRARSGKAMPVVLVDGNVTFLAADKEKNAELFEKKLGLVLQGNLVNAAATMRLHQPMKFPHHARHGGDYDLRPPHARGEYVFLSYSTDVEDEARRQILDSVSRKGITAVAPTTSVGLRATTQETCAPDVEIQSLLERIKFLEGQVRSTLPYLQMYKFGAGSLLVAIVSLLVWVFTGAGAPFHPIFAAMVIPVAIGLIVMAFLVRRDNPRSAEIGKQ